MVTPEKSNLLDLCCDKIDYKLSNIRKYKNPGYVVNAQYRFCGTRESRIRHKYSRFYCEDHMGKGGIDDEQDMDSKTQVLHFRRIM